MDPKDDAAATSGDVARPRGRPSTRNRRSLQWAVWRLVRAEVAHRGARSARDACAKIIRRLRVIRVDGLVRVVIADDSTLHQWYRAAERARSTDPELAAWCSAWEAQTAERWAEHIGLQAASRSLAESDRAGLTAVGCILDVSNRANTAAVQAHADPGHAPKPRKNRRR